MKKNAQNTLLPDRLQTAVNKFKVKRLKSLSAITQIKGALMNQSACLLLRLIIALLVVQLATNADKVWNV